MLQGILCIIYTGKNSAIAEFWNANLNDGASFCVRFNTPNTAISRARVKSTLICK